MITIAGSGLSAYDLRTLDDDMHSGGYDRIVLDRNYNSEANHKILHKLLSFESEVTDDRIFFGSLMECRAEILKILAEANDAKVLYIVTGSPLFFSGSRSLIAALEDNLKWFDKSRDLRIINAPSTLDRIQELRGIDLRDTGHISLHGRANIDLDGFLKNRFTVVLCDEETTGVISNALAFFDSSDVRITLFSRLGYNDEKILDIGLRDLDRIDGETSSKLAPFTILIERLYEPVIPVVFCEENLECDPGMITKPEKRSIILSELRLSPGMTLWDVGAGSGSVGIEASVRQKIFCTFFEKKSKRANDIRKNLCNHHVIGAKLFESDILDMIKILDYSDKMNGFGEPAPDRPEWGKNDLPILPDRIFVGGGGKELARRLPELIRFLVPGGRMVCAYVALNHLSLAISTLENAKIPFHVKNIALTEFRKGDLMIGEARRPLYLLIAEKDEK